MRALHGHGETSKLQGTRRAAVAAQPIAQPSVAAGSHTVQFYEDESALIEKLSDFAGSALGSGKSSIVILSRDHSRSLADRLVSWGFNLAELTRANRLIVLDAEECMSRFMVNGWPDRDRFFDVIEPELARAYRASERKGAKVAAFGEMVALLWERGQYETAVHLEKLWNELGQMQPMDLLCAYPLACFAHESQFDLFTQVCQEHSSVLPTESYTELRNHVDRDRMITSLQQKAATVHSVMEERELAIAQRKRAEEKLWRSEEFARKVVEGGVDCVTVLDIAGNLEYMSPSGLNSLEISDPKTVLGRSWVDFWKEEDRGHAKEALRVARSGGTGSFQGDISVTNAGRRYWDVRIVPANGLDGHVERLIAVSRDLTELRQAQQIAIQAEKLAAAGRMAATIAHEINNPLEAVTNFIYLARTTPAMPEESARYLEIADRELTRVAQIAQKTLGFYRDTSRNKWVAVIELMDDVLLIYDRKLRYKNLTARVLVDPGLKLFGKIGELKQALSNLLANAIDASSDGGTIWVRAHASLSWAGKGKVEHGIRITVADNGCGMSPDVQKRIFVPFFTTKGNVGTGIGLWVTKSLIEQQGGHLRFRSSQGQHSGTVMSFFVPTDSQPQSTEGVAA